MPGSPNTAAAWKHLVRDQRRRAELTKFAVAVLDDLDAGDQVADRGGGLLPRAGTGWKVADETHGQFAFHTGTEIVGETYGGAAAIQIAGGQDARGRPAQAEVFLHPPGRRADLEASGGGGAGALSHRILNRRTLG